MTKMVQIPPKNLLEFEVRESLQNLAYIFFYLKKGEIRITLVVEFHRGESATNSV